jgi:acyl-CoA synthetase (AMP-forming)/AMP-acid ligase II
MPSTVHTLITLGRAGVLHPDRPDRVARVLLALRRWGRTPAAGYETGKARDPDRVVLVDELGSLSAGELSARTNALARGLAGAGVKPGDNVAILCRNHRWFVEATVACSKLGANCLYLNTSFAGPQIADVVEREMAAALIYDEEFGGLVGDAGERRFVGWDDGAAADPTLASLIAASDDSPLKPPEQTGRFTILTSGTTGQPKGAQRSAPSGLSPAAAFLSRIPMHARETTMIAAPLFHSWGFAHFNLGLLLGSQLVLRRRFDPEGTLAAVAESRATALAVVPVMLQRILELPEDVRRRHDCSSLKVIAASGSTLPGELATRVMDEFGDVLYNLYGSTEVSWATIATPEQMRAAPGTAGSPPKGTVVRLSDSAGRPAETGRIFVGNEALFEGYTGGGGKEVIDGLMATGDVGHFDAAGRLFVDGRDDEMIVSGGENVFPREVEDLLAAHPAVEDVAVVGVPDDEFGQRLKAFVVRRDGAALTEDDVRELVRTNLARYKVPRDVEFLDELPRNATGKVLKRVLAER